MRSCAVEKEVADMEEGGERFESVQGRLLVVGGEMW